MRKSFLNIGSLVVIVVFMTSCQKEVTPPLEKFDNTTLLPTNQKEKERVETIKEIASILKEIYRKAWVVYEVNAAIKTEYYGDETVPLRDLLTPNKSPLYKTQKFISSGTQPGVFKRAFAEQLQKGSYPNLLRLFGQAPTPSSRTMDEWPANEIWTDQYGYCIYFPYSEDYPLVTPFDPNINTVNGQLVTIVAADREADSGPGQEPYVQSDPNLPQCPDNICYTTVTVDDNYADGDFGGHPTHIVGVIAEVPTEPPPPPPPAPGVSRIYIGEALCKLQYDRFISFTGNGGGSEIKYCHLTGYLQPVNGHITTFQDIVSVDFKRKDIKKKRWLRTFTVWDDDWVQNDLEQFLGIYEEDNTNTRSFNGSLSTRLDSLGIPVQGSIGFSITVQSQDDIIRQLKISRNSYFTGAFQDQAWGFSSDATFLPLPYTHGWPYYDTNGGGGANVGWTWPYNTY